LETDWNPYTPWERLPKWVRALLWTMFIIALAWAILTIAGDQG
jgi:hypothetical protein